jgi:hypothetical protein
MSLSKGNAKFLLYCSSCLPLLCVFQHLHLNSQYHGSLSIHQKSNLISDRHISREHSLVQRRPSAALDAFNAKLAASHRVSQGEEEFMNLTTTGGKSFSSLGFSGCIGAIIVSQQGAIIGHYSVTPMDMSKAATNIPALYNANRDKLADAEAFIYAEVKYKDQNTFVQPDIEDQLVSIITSSTGLTPRVQTYIEPLEAWEDQGGDDLDSPEYENAQYGAFLVENAGGGSALSTVTFVTIEMQVDSVAPN